MFVEETSITAGSSMRHQYLKNGLKIKKVNVAFSGQVVLFSGVEPSSESK